MQRIVGLALAFAAGAIVMSCRPVVAQPPELAAWCARFNARVRPMMDEAQRTLTPEEFQADEAIAALKTLEQGMCAK